MKSIKPEEKGTPSSLVFEGIPPPAVGVDESSDGASNDSATASWDFAESTCSASTQTEDAVSSQLLRLRVTELEHEVTLLQRKVDILEEEKREIAHKNELCNEQLDHCNAQIKDYIERGTEKDAEKKRLENLYRESLSELDFRNAKIREQEMEIEDLLKHLAAQQNEETANVTTKFYEAEEEISKLRDEKNEACKVMKAILCASKALRVSAEEPIENMMDPVSTYNILLLKGCDDFRMEELKKFANEFAIHALQNDSNLAVAFLANAADNVSGANSNDLVVVKCLDILRADPCLLLNSEHMVYLSSTRIESILKDTQMQAGELTMFRVLQNWYKADEPQRETICRDLVRHIKLERIDPIELATTVRSSGFVSDTQLCDAYGKQAKTKNHAEATKSQRAPPLGNSASHNKTKDINPIAIPSFASLKRGEWAGTSSDIFCGVKEDPKTWFTNRIAGQFLKENGLWLWEMRMEEGGEAIFGVTKAIFGVPKAPTLFQDSSLTEFGAYLPRRHFSKGSTIRFYLTIDAHKKMLSATIDGQDWISDMRVSIGPGLMMAACIRHGASVKFIGYRKEG
jgi:BTB And C-terminal Kelch